MGVVGFSDLAGRLIPNLVLLQDDRRHIATDAFALHQEIEDFLPEAGTGRVTRFAARGRLVTRDVEGDMRALPLRFHRCLEPPSFIVGGAPDDHRPFIQIVAVVKINHRAAVRWLSCRYHTAGPRAAFHARSLESGFIIASDMADRTTSFAKSVEGLHKEESALDNAVVLRNQFAVAKEKTVEQQNEKPQGEAEKTGSPMVREDAPVLKPTPSGPMRAGPDRVASVSKVKKEVMTEKQKQEEARKLLEIYRAQNPTHTRSHDHDRDR